MPPVPAQMPGTTHEDALGRTRGAPVAGTDEVGRGPLAGPVVAAAVILPSRLRGAMWSEVRDSKQLSAAERERLARAIRAQAVAQAVAAASCAEIDRLNILWASMLAMRRAVARLPVVPVHVLVDGNRAPDLPMPATAVIGGDAQCLSIAAASILAKTVRDRILARLDPRWPGYGFAAHAGYATPAHRAALRSLGPCPHHRRSFAPIRALLETEAVAGKALRQNVAAL